MNKSSAVVCKKSLHCLAGEVCTVRKHASSALQRRENIDGYLFLSPAIIFFLVFILFPFGYSFYLSLFEKTGKRITDLTFAGLMQYRQAINTPEFLGALRNTLVYTLSVVFFQLSIGLLCAAILNRRLLARDLTRGLIFTPVVLSTIVCGIVWCWLYNPDTTGLINRFLARFGIRPIAWLRDPKWAMFSVVFMSVWKWIGYFMVIYLAAMQDISPNYYEAADIEGANGWNKFWRITFPLLSETTWLLIITSIINSFQIFDQIYTMTSGGPVGATNVLVYYIYQQAFVYFNLPFASAIAWLMFVVIFILTLFQLFIQNRSEAR